MTAQSSEPPSQARPGQATPSTGGVTTTFEFLDASGEPTPKPNGIDAEGNPNYAKLAVTPDAVICFMDADGTLWLTGTSMEPKRIKQRPTSIDPGGPETG